MIMWIMSAGFILFGLIVFVRGRLGFSEAREIVGARAKVVGAALVAIPIVSFACTVVAQAVFQLADVREETANMWAGMTFYLVFAFLTLTTALVASLLAVKISPARKGGFVRRDPDFLDLPAAAPLANEPGPNAPSESRG